MPQPDGSLHLISAVFTALPKRSFSECSGVPRTFFRNCTYYIIPRERCQEQNAKYSIFFQTCHNMLCIRHKKARAEKWAKPAAERGFLTFFAPSETIDKGGGTWYNRGGSERAPGDGNRFPLRPDTARPPARENRKGYRP